MILNVHYTNCFHLCACLKTAIFPVVHHMAVTQSLSHSCCVSPLCLLISLSTTGPCAVPTLPLQPTSPPPNQAVYITATCPFLILAILFFRGVTLEGAGEGLRYLFIPRSVSYSTSKATSLHCHSHSSTTLLIIYVYTVCLFRATASLHPAQQQCSSPLVCGLRQPHRSSSRWGWPREPSSPSPPTPRRRQRPCGKVCLLVLSMPSPPSW